MTSLRYHPVEPETLEIQPEDIYLRDNDTENIFGDPTGRVTIGMRELFMVHHRFELRQKSMFFGSMFLIVIFAFVALFLIRSGYKHVQEDIMNNKVRARTGLQITPTMNIDGRSLIMLFEGDKAKHQEKYVEEINKYLDAYTKEQDSRRKFVSDCNSTEAAEETWCNFNISLIPGSEECTKENKYGYFNKEPCFLIRFKDKIGWQPQFKQNSTHTELPFKCVLTHPFLNLEKSEVNITYIPNFQGDDQFGGFALTKIPSKTLTRNGEDVIDDDGETLYDLPPLAFIKIGLPDNYMQGVVTCRLISNHPDATITNLESLDGIREQSFSLTFHSLESNLFYLTEE
ncbi:unnamed protein product [Auanema sp. JU1783]|nr:unnamed protein product [Auanema sp. JU1783]